jgi:hypothetical protein
MSITQKQQMVAWVKTWKAAGEALKDIKRQELLQYDYEKNLPIIEDMLQWAYEHRTPRLTSGLVEQQRWFSKMRKQLLKQQSKGEDSHERTV